MINFVNEKWDVGFHFVDKNKFKVNSIGGFSGIRDVEVNFV